MPHQRSRRYVRWKKAVDHPKELYFMPPELLFMIFDLFAPVSIDHSERLECWRVLLQLRATCYRFRTIVNELPFWFDNSFKLIEMIPIRRFVNPQDRYKAQFLGLLFQDKRLVRSLGRRTSWHFTGNQTLRMIINCIPSFLRSKSVSFYPPLREPRYMQDVLAINDAILALEPLKSLTTLTIDQISDIDLRLINMSCPSLRDIKITHSRLFSGTLDGLGSLESVFVCGCTNIPQLPGHSLSLVPTSSAACLTRLSLIFGTNCRGFHDEPYLLKKSYDGLAAFFNLKCFYIHPMTDDLCDFLARTSIELDELRTTVIKKHGTATLTKIINLFKNRSLRRISSLCLAVQDNNDWRSSYQSMVECITTGLRGIEEIVLGMGMDVAWLPMFCNLENLRRLTWYVPGDDSFAFTAKMPNDWDILAIDNWQDRFMWKGRDFIPEFLSGFQEIPKVKVKVFGGWLLRCWWWLSCLCTFIYHVLGTKCIREM